jgi:hypothetical protein
MLQCRMNSSKVRTGLLHLDIEPPEAGKPICRHNLRGRYANADMGFPDRQGLCAAARRGQGA